MTRLLITLSYLIAMFALAACSMAPRLETTSARAIELGGHWTLDRQVSDDVRARLKPLFEKRERQWRKAERRFEDPQSTAQSSDASPVPGATAGQSGPPESLQGQAVSNLRWMQGQRQRESQALIAAVLPANEVDIVQSQHDLKFASNKGEGTRVFVPGESSSLFVAIGGFLVTAGWQAQTFIVDSRGTGENGLHIVERYNLLDANRLEELLEIKIPAIGKQTFRLVYKRG